MGLVCSVVRRNDTRRATEAIHQVDEDAFLTTGEFSAIPNAWTIRSRRK